MLGLAAGIFLILVLLVVHVQTQRKPLEEHRPLNVDRNLPLPWAGQASTVFSVTALFGAYLAIFEVLGVPAIFGVCLGTVAGLLAIRHVCLSNKASSFERFLVTRRFSEERLNNALLWCLLAVTQMGYAASELVILRDLSIRGFGMMPKQATLFAISLALIGYFYCLLGGWAAVFRTDIVQLVFMITMFAWLAVASLTRVTYLPGGHSLVLSHVNPAIWSLGIALPPIVSHALHFLVGFVMGAGLLACSPDTWKRVYVSAFFASGRKFLFGKLVFAGVLPFLLLAPIALSVGKVAAQTLDPLTLIFSIPTTQLLLMVVLLGMISCFLSSFNSALLIASQIILTRPFSSQRAAVNTLQNYNVILGCTFLAIFLFAMGVISGFANPYLIAVLLLGPYSVLGGLIVGTRGLARPFRGAHFPWLPTTALVGWFFYVMTIPEILTTPTESDMTAAPVGVCVFFLFLTTTLAGSAWARGRRNVSDPR